MKRRIAIALCFLTVMLAVAAPAQAGPIRNLRTRVRVVLHGSPKRRTARSEPHARLLQRWWTKVTQTARGSQEYKPRHYVARQIRTFGTQMGRVLRTRHR